MGMVHCAVFLPACHQLLGSYLYLLCWCHTGKENRTSCNSKESFKYVLMVRQALGDLLKTGGTRSRMSITYSYIESSWSVLLNNVWSAKKQLGYFSLSTHNHFAKRGAQQEPLSKPRHQLGSFIKLIRSRGFSKHTGTNTSAKKEKTFAEPNVFPQSHSSHID